MGCRFVPHSQPKTEGVAEGSHAPLDLKVQRRDCTIRAPLHTNHWSIEQRILLANHDCDPANDLSEHGPSKTERWTGWLSDSHASGTAGVGVLLPTECECAELYHVIGISPSSCRCSGFPL